MNDVLDKYRTGYDEIDDEIDDEWNDLFEEDDEVSIVGGRKEDFEFGWDDDDLVFEDEDTYEETQNDDNKSSTRLENVEFVNYTDPILVDEELSSVELSKLFNIDTRQFDDNSVRILPFSARVLNQFAMHGVKTIDEMLSYSISDFRKWRGFGAGCLNELLKVVRSLISEKREIPASLVLERFENSANMIANAIDSENSIGEELNQYKSDNAYCGILVDALRDIALRLVLDKYKRKLLNRISKEILDAPSFDVIRGFNNSYSFVRMLVDEEEKNKSFSEVLEDKYERWIQLPVYERFEKWLLLDFSSVLDCIHTTDLLDDRMLDVLYERSKGTRLNIIGEKHGITRERVRQIELKGCRKLQIYFDRLRLMNLLKLRYNENKCFSSTDIEPLFGDDGWLVVHFLKTADVYDIKYIKELDMFLFCDRTEINDIKKRIAVLPESFMEEDLAQLLGVSSVKKWQLAMIGERYIQVDGYFYSRYASKASICESVLRAYFPRGIHVYDESELNLFRKRAYERYGQDKLSSTNRALATRITDVGILCDRGTYKAKQDKYISDELLEKIDSYISQKREPVYLFSTLFVCFESELREQGVNNRFYLQGILKEALGKKYEIRKDCLVYDAKAVNFSTSVVDFVIRQCKPVTKQELYEKYPGISEIVVNMAMSDPAIINLFGSYIAADRLGISEHEIRYLRRIVDIYVKGNKTVNVRAIYYRIMDENPYMLKRNYITQPFSFFSLLMYLFEDEYNFERPFIARKGVQITDIRDVLLAYVSDRETVDLSEVTALAKKQHYQIANLLGFANDCNETHYLVSNHQLAAIDYLGIDETWIDRIEDILATTVNETMPICQLNCVHLFPQIAIQWNEWIIYSMIKKLSTKFDVAMSMSQLRMSTPLISPKGKMDLDCPTINGIRNEMLVADNLDNIDSLVSEFIEEEL